MTLSANSDEEAGVKFTDIRIVEGVMPMPSRSLDRTHPLIVPPLSQEPQITSGEREWDFTRGLDLQQWRIVNAFDSSPQNLRATPEGLVITAWGKQAKNKKKSGAILYSREYFGSGRYDLWAQVGPAYDAQGRSSRQSGF